MYTLVVPSERRLIREFLYIGGPFDESWIVAEKRILVIYGCIE
jgi:hypothetical protein